MRIRGSAYFFMLLVAVMVFVILWSLLAMTNYQSQLLPVLFGSIGLILAAVGLWRDLRRGKEPAATKEDTAAPKGQVAETWRGYLSNGAWIVGFLVAIYLVGYLIAIAVFTLLYMKWLGTRWRVSVIYAILVPVVIYLVFELGLKIEMYRGLFLGA